MPNPRSLPSLSPAEQALMDLIWRMQPATVGELLGAVNDGRAEALRRNTVQTQLQRLAAKGWLRHTAGDPVRRYRATVPARNGRGRVLADLKQRLFGGSGLSLVRCLMEDGGLTREELGELNQLLKEHQKGNAK
jgi:BlaI family penicillinase repressor